MQTAAALSRDPSVPAAAPVEVRCHLLERDGFVIIRDAVGPTLLDALRRDVDAVHREQEAAGRMGPGGSLHLLGSACRRDSFLELLDLPGTFDVVCRLLGWNIHVYHSHLDVHPPASAAAAPEWGWHQDGGRLNLDLETDPRPMISLKVAFWLSDVSTPGRGNTLVLPGSHRDNTLDRPAEREVAARPPEAVELLASAGDAVVLDRRLWHSRSPNRSSVTRRALFLAYAPRWLRPRDDHGLDQLDAEHPGLTPVRRQLLGHGQGPMDFWGLGDQPAPLHDELQRTGRLDRSLGPHR